VVVTEYSSNMCNSGAANGDVVFWTLVTPPEVPQCEIFRYREGEVTQLTNCGKDECECPLTDGNIVVYMKCLPGLGPEECAVAVVDGSGSEVVLAPPTVNVFAGQDYAVNNGWIAFTKKGPSGVLQVWLRNPGGVEKQVSFFGKDSPLESLGPDGDVMFSCNNGGDWKRCFASFDKEAKDIGHGLGRARNLNGKWYVMMGRVLFGVDLTEPSCAQGDDCGDGPPDAPEDEGGEEVAPDEGTLSDIAKELSKEVEEGTTTVVDDGGAVEDEQDEGTPLAPDEAPATSEDDDIQSQQTDSDETDDMDDGADSPPLNGKPGGGGCTSSGGRSGIALPVLLLLAVWVFRRLGRV
jgi:uncharacterized protein (TIGR03382 family)